MSEEKRSIWMWLSLGLLCLTIFTTYLAIYYYTEFQKYQTLYNEALSKFSKYILVNILINYGNGTASWYNNTAVAIGSNLLQATKIIAKVEYTEYSFGVFVTSINNVAGNKTHAWLWYIWNSTKRNWDLGPTGADGYILKNGDIISWIYTKWA